MIHQDAALFGATLSDGQSVTHIFSGYRKGYLVPSRGTVLVNGTEISERAGAAIAGEREITITARGDAEFVLADLA